MEVQSRVWLREKNILRSSKSKLSDNPSLSSVATYITAFVEGLGLLVSLSPLWRNVGKRACAACIWGWVLTDFSYSFCSFETGFLCVVSADLELAL